MNAMYEKTVKQATPWGIPCPFCKAVSEELAVSGDQINVLCYVDCRYCGKYHVEGNYKIEG